MWYKAEVRDPLFPGPDVVLDGQLFRLAATSAALLDALPHAIAGKAALERGDIAAQFESALKLALAFLRQNYPELTAEELGKHSTLRNLADIVDIAGTAVAKGIVQPTPQPTLANRLQRRDARLLH